MSKYDLPNQDEEFLNKLEKAVRDNLDDSNFQSKNLEEILYVSHSTLNRKVKALLDTPCILTYTGRGFDGSMTGKYGPVEKYSGMLLETIHAADSPNQERFPSTLLRPGQTFRSTTQFRFFAK